MLLDTYTLEFTLNWSHHTDTICKNIACRLGIFKRVRSMLNIHTAKLLYNSLVLSHFDYCNIVVNNSHAKLQDRLQKIKSRGARIIMCEHYRSNNQQMHNSLKWFTVSDRTTYLYGLYMLKWSCSVKHLEFFSTSSHRPINQG